MPAPSTRQAEALDQRAGEGQRVHADQVPLHDVGAVSDAVAARHGGQRGGHDEHHRNRPHHVVGKRGDEHRLAGHFAQRPREQAGLGRLRRQALRRRDSRPTAARPTATPAGPPSNTRRRRLPARKVRLQAANAGPAMAAMTPPAITTEIARLLAAGSTAPPPPAGNTGQRPGIRRRAQCRRRTPRNRHETRPIPINRRPPRRPVRPV